MELSGAAAAGHFGVIAVSLGCGIDHRIQIRWGIIAPPILESRRVLATRRFLDLLDPFRDPHDLIAAHTGIGRAGMHDKLVQNKQADIVVAALSADLERLVDHVEQAQQVEEEKRQEAERHQRLDPVMDFCEHEQGQDHHDEADDHGICGGQELLALNLINAQERLAESGLLLAQAHDVIGRNVGFL